MPIYLKDISELSELEKINSVLIVPCRFCPAASMAVRTNEPYFEFFRQVLKTASYEKLIKTTKFKLEIMGVKTEVFRSNLPHQFVLCMWTKRRRKKLLKCASQYDALVVLGCESAVQTVYDSVKSTNCKVFQGMRSEGIMSILPQFHLPCNISLKLNNLTPLFSQDSESQPWVTL